MPLRKLLLRVMLWSLAAAALLGAMGILLGGSRVMWSVAETTILTAISAGLLMGASILVDRPHGRTAGLFAMSVILADTVLLLLLIWGDWATRAALGVSSETIAMTVLFSFLPAIPATFCLYWQKVPSAAIACRTGVFISAVVFIQLMVPTWAQGLRVSRWFDSAGATAWFGYLATFSLLGVQRDPAGGRLSLVMVRLIGTVAAAAAWAIAVWGVWNAYHETSGIFVVTATVAMVLAHANLCLLAPLRGAQAWIRVGTIVSAVAAAICIDYAKVVTPDEFIIRIGGAAGFVCSCGSLALIVLAKINRKAYVEPQAYQAATELTVICPGCSKKQTLAIGESVCPACRLQFHIRIEVPRCSVCNYTLFMLTSDRCPECGTVVSKASSIQQGGALV